MQDIILFFKDRKNLFNFLSLLVIILGLPVAVNLAREQEVLKSSAAGTQVEILGPETNTDIQSRGNKNVLVIKDGQTSATIGVKLHSPIESQASAPQSPVLASLVRDGLVPNVYADCHNICRTCSGSHANDAGCDGDPNHPDICDGPQICDDCSPPSSPVTDCNDGRGNTGHKYCVYTSSGNKVGSNCIIEACVVPGAKPPDCVAPNNPSPPATTPTPTTSGSGCSGGNFTDKCGTSKSFSGACKELKNAGWPPSCSTSSCDDIKNAYNGVVACNAPPPPPPAAAPPPPPPAAPKPTTKQFKLVISDIVGAASALNAATAQTYTTGPVNVVFDGKNYTPGPKNIYVQFLSSAGKWTDPDSTPITVVEADPKIDSVACGIDISNSGINFTVSGKHLGSDKPSVSVNPGTGDINVNPTSWSPTAVTSNISGSQASSDSNFSVKLTRADGIPANFNGTCHIGLSTINVSTPPTCPSLASLNSGQQINNVEFYAIEAGNPNAQVVNETLSVDTSGRITGIRTKFQSDKSYKISVKVPRSLRRGFGPFKPGGATYNINFDKALPLGDIAPGTGDGAINSFDKSELESEWGLGRNKPADLNGDGIVNSLDWSCMKKSFDQSNDPIPGPDSGPATSPSPSTSPSSSPSTSVSPSP